MPQHTAAERSKNARAKVPGKKKKGGFLSSLRRLLPGQLGRDLNERVNRGLTAAQKKTIKERLTGKKRKKK